MGILGSLLGGKVKVPKDERKIAEHARDLARESQSAWRISQFAPTGGSSLGTLVHMWETNARRYLGDHWEVVPREGLSYFTINKTLNAIEGNVAVQFGNGIRIKIIPRESGEPASFALRERAGRTLVRKAAKDPQLAQILAEGGFTEDQYNGNDVLSDEQVEILDQLLNPPAPLPIENAATGEVTEQEPPPPAFNPADMVLINDALFAEAMHNVWDTQFKNASGDLITMENELYTNIFGHQPMLFQFDVDEKQMVLENPSVFGVMFPPHQSNIKNFDYTVFDQLLSVDEAKTMIPKERHQILDELGQKGLLRGKTPNAHSGTSTDNIYPLHARVDFRRPMVTIRTLWERHHIFPMWAHEALAHRLIEVTEPGEDGGAATPEETPQEARGTTEDSDVIYLITAKGEKKGLGKETDPITPADKTWPTVKGIMQTTIIDEADMVIDRQRCPYLDIPMGNNKNSLIPYSPYGMGEPMKLEDVSTMINRLFSMIYNVINFNQTPQIFLSRSMENALGETGSELFVSPDKIIVLDDVDYEAILAAGGKILMIEPPQIPNSWIGALQLALKQHDDLSVQSAVRQGRAPFSGASGAVVKQLQQASTSTLQLKAMHTEWMLERIASLLLDAVGKWFDEEDWKLYTAKWPPVVLKMIRRRAKSMKFDVQAVVTGGRTGDLEQVKSEARQDYQIGLKDREGTLERLGDEDPSGTAAKIEAEQMGMAEV